MRCVNCKAEPMTPSKTAHISHLTSRLLCSLYSRNIWPAWMPKKTWNTDVNEPVRVKQLLCIVTELKCCYEWAYPGLLQDQTVRIRKRYLRWEIDKGDPHRAVPYPDNPWLLRRSSNIYPRRVVLPVQDNLWRGNISISKCTLTIIHPRTHPCSYYNAAMKFKCIPTLGNLVQATKMLWRSDKPG